MASLSNNAMTEVPVEKQGGLPQLDFSTYEEQLVWLFLSFIVLFVVVWRFALPKIASVLEEREERIAEDLDRAECVKADAETVRATCEAAAAQARRSAQETILKVKEAAAADLAKETAALDAKLAKQASDAEAKIAAVKAEALGSVDTVATEVATDIVARLSGVGANDADVAKAVKAVAEGA